METTPDQACENNNKYIQLAPDDDFSNNPYRSIKIWTPLYRAILAFIISYLAFLSFDPNLHSSLLLTKPEFNTEAYLNHIAHLSIQLDRKVIRASSLNEQIFPLLISRQIQELDSHPKTSVDLIIVLDFSRKLYHQKERTHKARALFKQFLPLMTDQDRLSVVLVGGALEDGPILSILPFTNMTRENQKKVISSLGENILKGEASKLEGPVDILSKRTRPNQATGVFLISDESLEFRERIVKERLGLQDVDTVLTLYSDHPKELESFKRGLEVLQNGVVRTQLLIKPEESQLFKGVEILNKYGKTVPYTWREHQWMSRDGSFLREDKQLNFGQKDYVFDLKIPRVTQPLPSSPTEVKLASCQLTFTLLNGSQVTKSVDLTVKVVGEGEEFIHEEESPEVMKNFYKKWGYQLWRSDEIKDVFRRFKESLDNSFVKDDEDLQKVVKRIEEFIIRRDYWRNFEPIQEDYLKPDLIENIN